MKKQEGLRGPNNNTLIADSASTKKFIRKNVYLCNACGGGWVSADLDKGVTPFMDQCPLCGRLEGRSLFYNVPQAILADIPPRVEWYRPTHAETAGLANMMLDHVQNGGLMRRLVPVAPKMATRIKQ